MNVKDILKSIFPLPAKKQRQEFADIKAKLKMQETLISKNEDKIKLLLEALVKSQDVIKKHGQTLEKQNVEIKQQEESFAKELTQIQGYLRKVDANIVPKVLWSRKFERNVVKLNWGDVTEQADFADKFIKLTKGLDAKSVQAIIRILSRQKAYLNSDKESLDLFTRAEQEEIRLLKENFYSEILKLSDNLFAYRNYLLPVKHFESSVFYYKHGLEEAETADSVAGKTIIDVGGVYWRFRINF